VHAAGKVAEPPATAAGRATPFSVAGVEAVVGFLVRATRTGQEEAHFRVWRAVSAPQTAALAAVVVRSPVLAAVAATAAGQAAAVAAAALVVEAVVACPKRALSRS
jgi:hypothetical protein